MAKFLGNVVVLEETNLPALFYYRHLLEQRMGNPVYYFDEIDKAGIDKNYNNLVVNDENPKFELVKDALNDVLYTIKEFNKTVYHGFKYNVVHENIKDEGLAKKQAQAIQKMIKNHEAPYNNIFKKYIVTIIQG